MGKKVISVSSLVENNIPKYFYVTIRKGKRYHRPGIHAPPGSRTNRLWCVDPSAEYWTADPETRVG